MFFVTDTAEGIFTVHLSLCWCISILCIFFYMFESFPSDMDTDCGDVKSV